MRSLLNYFITSMVIGNMVGGLTTLFVATILALFGASEMVVVVVLAQAITFELIAVVFAGLLISNVQLQIADPQSDRDYLASLLPG